MHILPYISTDCFSGSRLFRTLANGVMIFCLLLLAIAPVRAQAQSEAQDALDAARLGQTRALETLLRKGISTETADEQGNTLLILSAREGFAPTVQLLLDKGAAVNVRNQHGENALMLAILKDHKAVVHALLLAGAPVDHPEPLGWTPLHYAAFEGHLHWVEALIKAGANVNALAPNHANALMLAARNGHMPIVRRLLQTPVHLGQKTDQGLTAQAWAREVGNTDIADLIDRAQQVRQEKRP
jgi:uncharacterized protein